MHEMKTDLDAALSQVGPSWDHQRTERTLKSLPKRRARQHARKAVMALGAVAATAAIIFFGWRDASFGRLSGTAVAVTDTSQSETNRALELADGSRVFLIDEATNVKVERMLEGEWTLRMASGRARFEVARKPTRIFRVECGDVVVEVLGTVFEILREQSRAQVHVIEGRVAVTTGGKRVELAAGESKWFSEGDPKDERVAVDTSPTDDATERGKQLDVSSPADVSWKTHAENGEFARAFEMIKSSRKSVRDNVQELLLAADSARLSGHPSDAVPYLRQVIDRHPSDGRSSLAAFTLGGVLMNQLGRPQEAEVAYAQARALAPGGALAQDALARQVEAAHRSGDTGRSRSLALEYLKSYPEGRRVNAVRRFGGLE